MLIAGSNEIDVLITYLAVLFAGHPVLLAPGDNPDNVRAWSPRTDPTWWC
ncbi:hypothetical protein [Nocardia sp. 348MFTsu5.1]